MRIASSMRSLVLAASLTYAGLIPRQTPSTLATLPSGAWIENVIVRANGNALLSRFDTPEVWSLDLSTKQASRVLSIAGATALTGITEVSPDVFAVISGNATVKGAISIKAGSWTVWKVDLSGATPKTTLVKQVPESSFFIDITPFNNDTVFIADAGKGAIYKLTLSTGEYSVALSDASLKAPSNAAIQEGVHGLKYHDGNLYFTNTFGNSVGKIKVDTTTGNVTGPIVNTAGTYSGPEDFAIGPDGSIYIAQLTAGNILKVTPDGKSTKVATVSSASSVAFGRKDTDKNTLYVSTSGGAVLSVSAS